MKKLVIETVAQHEKNKNDAQTIAIFIINRKSEMLLHKKPSEKQQLITSWEPPHFVHHNSTITPYSIAKLYVNQLGIECELHEAFSPALQSNHIIIALTKEHEKEPNFATGAYKWMHINSILNAMHEYPTLYASSFRVALEGIQLFVKNILNNNTCDQLSIQSELQ